MVEAAGCAGYAVSAGPSSLRHNEAGNVVRVLEGAPQMLWALAFAGGLFLGMLLMQHVGHGIAMRRIALDPESATKGAGVIEAAIFGLLSLLVAFTFSGAVSRFDGRRHLVSEEANRIGTAWDRIDLLPEGAQRGMRDLFMRYLDSRLETYRQATATEFAQEEWNRSVNLQREIWIHGVAAGREAPTTTASMLFLPAVNQMIDITGTRLMATRTHPPPIVFAMLAVMG